MKIKKIEIHNFRGLTDVVIDNLDKNLNLLIGINGAGKSSVLDATVLLLQPFTARLTSSAGRGMSIRSIDVKKRTQMCKLYIELENGVYWSRYKKRGLEKSEGGDLSRLIEFTLQTRISLDNSENINLPIIIHYGVNRTVPILQEFSIVRRSMDKQEENKQSDAYSNWVIGGVFFRDFMLWYKEVEAEENRKRIDENPEYRDRGLQAVREAMKIIFPEYSEMRMMNSHQIGLKKGDNNLLLDQLSDGEKCYITLVSDIVRRLAIANPTGEVLKGEGIVLIDEVDLHLHPSWEVTVMEKLNLVFPNIQFIVSAHSPLVASHFDGQVYGMRNGEVDALPRLHGLDYSTILLQYMGVRPEHREINSLVEMYRSYIRHDMQTQAEAVWNRLVELMGGDLEAPVLKNLKRQN